MGNKLRLKEEHIGYLSNQPEQGMGYQIVDITLKNGQLLNDRIVLNSSYLKLNESEQIDLDDIAKIEIKINSENRS
ncbi:MAG TPA: hypothetical protein GX007_08220 [Bacteroidales bacterium]|jgi:hypothetical protein|nr:hypothetical protein [Bacteroidales bacterium]